MAIKKQPSCADEMEPALMPVDEAVRRIADLITPLAACETLPIRECLGRALAADVISPIDVPPYTNSAMDGYAIHGSDIPEDGETHLKIVGTAWAGRPTDVELSRGQATRIMTGAAMPDGADTVVIQENVQVDGDSLRIDADNRSGANVRLAGEDVRRGEVILKQGESISPAHMGMLASLGVSSVSVVRKVKVAFFSTGDELRSLAEDNAKPLGKGEIYDSNRYSLYGMLQRLGVDIVDLGVIADQAELIRDAFLHAAETADVVVTSGGVSVGDADFVSEVLHEIGEVAFWKLAMRPGRPLACGKIRDTLFFGLPGNPVAVMVGFYEFVQPAIRQLMGCRDTAPIRFSVRCEGALRKSKGRTEYQRGVLFRDEHGETRVRSTGKQGAGRLSSMCVANCMIVIQPGDGNISDGDLVEVQPFQGLV